MIEVALITENGEEVPVRDEEGNLTGYQRVPLPAHMAVTPVGAELEFLAEVVFPYCQSPKGYTVTGHVVHWQEGYAAGGDMKAQKVRRRERVRIQVRFLQDFSEWNSQRGILSAVEIAHGFFGKEVLPEPAEGSTTASAGLDVV